MRAVFFIMRVNLCPRGNLTTPAPAPALPLKPHAVPVHCSTRRPEPHPVKVKCSRVTLVLI